jgi:hypothetical protein
LQIKTIIVSCCTADSKPVKQEVNGTAILPPLVFLAKSFITLPPDGAFGSAAWQIRQQHSFHDLGVEATTEGPVILCPDLGPTIENFLRPHFMNVRNKLECSSLANLSSLISCLQARKEPTQKKHAPFKVFHSRVGTWLYLQTLH